MEYFVEELLGKELTTSEDGCILFSQIRDDVKNKMKVEINFTNVKVASPTFFEALFIQLLLYYDRPLLKENVTLINLAPKLLEIAKATLEESEKKLNQWELPELEFPDE
jgi:hypothetical protein